jgi:hypothetical protein
MELRRILESGKKGEWGMPVKKYVSRRVVVETGKTK